MAFLRCADCGAFAPALGCPHCGSKKLTTTKKVLAAAAVGASVFMILPGCAYGCPPDACGLEADAGRVPAQPEVLDDGGATDSGGDATIGDASPNDAANNADANETGSTDASGGGG